MPFAAGYHGPLCCSLCGESFPCTTGRDFVRPMFTGATSPFSVLHNINVRQIMARISQQDEG